MVCIMHTHTPIPRFLSPVCTMHTEITLWLQHGNSRFSHAICHPNSHEALPFQYCNHVSNYSVQCAIGEIGAGPDCILHTAMTQVWWYWNDQILTFYTLPKNVKFHPFQYLITWVVQCAVCSVQSRETLTMQCFVLSLLTYINISHIQLA